MEVNKMQTAWEILYRENQHHSVWPWTDLISEVKKLKIKNNTVLELGCGMGANIPFFISEGHNYFGVDASQTAILYNKKKFPLIEGNIKECDFTKEIPFKNKFDLIFDRASITHNDNESILKCLNTISQKINSKGYFIGIDWFSKNHSDYCDELEMEAGTKSSVNSAQFKGTGKVHFFDRQEIKEIFTKNNLTIIKMEEKIFYHFIDDKNISKRASFNFVAVKNE